MTGIYCVRHGDRFYVGQSVDIRKRQAAHRDNLERGRHINPKLQRACDKHGIDSFEFEVIELCDRAVLTEKEQYWIDTLDSCSAGFNCGPAAISSMRGRKHSPESLFKMSLASRGRMQSAATRLKRADANRGKKLKPLSLETRAKISASKLGKSGRRVSEATRVRMREAALLREEKKRLMKNIVHECRVDGTTNTSRGTHASEAEHGSREADHQS